MSPEKRKKLIIAFPELAQDLIQQENEEKLAKIKKLASSKLPPELLEKIKSFKGDTGEKGDKGDKGDIGIGINGKNGIDGKDGEQGIQGERGDKGETGPKGDTGEKGEDGRDGVLDPKLLKPLQKKIEDGMKEVDGRIKAVDLRWRGGGLTKVSTDTTLTGQGTGASPLSVVTSVVSSKVAIDASDTTPNFLASKLVAGTNTTVTINNAGGNETAQTNVVAASSNGAIQYNVSNVLGGVTTATLNASGQITLSGNPGNLIGQLNILANGITGSLKGQSSINFENVNTTQGYFIGHDIIGNGGHNFFWYDRVQNTSGIYIDGSSGVTTIYLGSSTPTGLSSSGNVIVGGTSDNGVDKLQVTGTSNVTSTSKAQLFQTTNAPTANSTGTVAIVAKDASSATNNAGWLPMKRSDGTTIYLPYWI